MLLYIWTLCLLVALYLYFRGIYTKFSKRGVRQLPIVPLLGDMTRVLLRQEHIVERINRVYKAFPNDRFVGTFEFVSPVVIIRDLGLIKQITVKDFEHFQNHRGISSLKDDEIFGRFLFALRDEEWKDMRSTLSPAFTSSKMRLMVPFMVEVGDHMLKSVQSKIQDSKSDYIDVDIKDLMTRYANDVIATCAFGLVVDSHQDENNHFYKMATTFLDVRISRALPLIIFSSFPWLKNYFDIRSKIMLPEIRQFFRHLILDSMKTREAKNIVRPDMIHLLMEAKKGKLTYDEISADNDAGFATVEESAIGKRKVNREWSDTDLVAQGVIFLLAGFETVSTAMSFLLHELAVNPEVQERLVQEIRQNEERSKGKFDFNSVQQLTYLDMVVSEALRLWPPAANTDRICTKDYNLGKPNSEANYDYIVHKGETVYIPIWSIHHDPDYYPDPYKFDPERFSEQNKHNIKPFTYMPFGLGPRNCIGSRFALCEVKVMVYHLLKHLEVSPCPKTPIPAALDKHTITVRMQGGHWLRIKCRKE